MAALRPRYVRNGRLKHGYGRAPLPVVWVEASNHATPSENDPIWSLPNTYPFIGFDLRRGRDAGGNEVTFPTTDITPEAFTYAALQYTQEYIDRFGPVFARLGKSLRFGWRLKGPDAVFGDCTLLIAEDPHDCGLPGPPSDIDDPAVRPVTVLFHTRARQHLRAWAEGVATLLGEAFASSSAPKPEVCFADFESMPAYHQSYRSRAYFFDWLGWFEDSLAKASRLTALDTSYVMDGGEVFHDWLAARALDRRGLPVTYNQLKRQTSPTNFEAVHRAGAASEMSYTETVRHCFFEPLKAALGSGLQCGNWAQFTDSIEHQRHLYPDYTLYWKRGVFGYDVQIPNNYGSRYDYFIIDSPPDSDPGWPTVQAWLDFFQLNGVAGGPGRNARDLINREVYSQWTRAAVRSNEQRALTPSVSIDPSLNPVQPGVDPYVDEAIPHLVEYMLRAAALGANGYWLFTDRWALDADMRLYSRRLIESFNQRASARTFRRNQMQRSRRW